MAKDLNQVRLENVHVLMEKRLLLKSTTSATVWPRLTLKFHELEEV